MYTLQIIDADSNKVVIRRDFDTPDKILRLLHMAQIGVGKDCYFLTMNL